MSTPVDEATTGLPADRPLPPLGSVGLLRWMWRQLTSMRTALILLFLLAIASVPGSVLPQRGTNPLRVDQWLDENPTTGPLLDRLGFFDVYASPWFAAVYLLLFVSLIGCVIPRIRQHAKSMRALPPPAPRRMTRLPMSDEFTVAADATATLAAAEQYLRDHRWRVRTGETAAEGSAWVAAEKGYLRETGNLVFHLSLLFVLLAVAVGGLLGWKGNVIVREGEGFSNTLTQYDAWGGGRFVDPSALAPFSFTLDSFTVDFERGDAQRGAPRLFEADVTYREAPDAEPVSTTIAVNHPLDVDGAKVFLVGHGYAPRFVIRDSTGEVVFDDTVVFLPQDGNFTSTGVVKVPDATPSLGLNGLFLPTAALTEELGPHSTFPGPDYPAVFLSAFSGDLGLDSGSPQSVYTPRHDRDGAARPRVAAPGRHLDAARGRRLRGVHRVRALVLLPDRPGPRQGAGAAGIDSRDRRADAVPVRATAAALGQGGAHRRGRYPRAGRRARQDRDGRSHRRRERAGRPPRTIGRRREERTVTSVQLAQASNAAVYATMVTLAIAMVFFAVSFAAGRRRTPVAASAASVVESAGGTAVITRPPAVADEPAEPGRRAANIGMSLTWLAFFLLLAGVVLRGVWAGRAPWGNMYEFSISAALGVLGVFLIMSIKRDLRWLGLFVVIPTLLWLGLAVTVLYTEAAQLVPALKSYWLVIHVAAAIICFGAFTMAGATAGLALARGRAERRQGTTEVTGWTSRMPTSDRLEVLTNRVVAFSFPLWTFAVVAGAIWAENAWGRYWGWDPKETWAFITWVVFAAYLHARSTAGWRGSRASWIAIAGWVSFIINYFGVNIFATGLHSYGGL